MWRQRIIGILCFYTLVLPVWFPVVLAGIPSCVSLLLLPNNTSGLNRTDTHKNITISSGLIN